MHTGNLVWRQAVVCAPGMCNLTSKLKLNLFTHLFSSEKDPKPPFSPPHTHMHAPPEVKLQTAELKTAIRILFKVGRHFPRGQFCVRYSPR